MKEAQNYRSDTLALYEEMLYNQCICGKAMDRQKDGKGEYSYETEKLTEKALRWLFTKYLTLLEKTVKINWHEENEYGESQIFGFWHEDSFL